MVDKSNVEINALEEEFPGKSSHCPKYGKALMIHVPCLVTGIFVFFPESKILLCDFHREKAWVEWCRKTDHGVRDQQDTLLKLLRAVASASSPEEYYTRLSELQDSDVWKRNCKVQTWLSTHWLPEAEVKWVHAFRSEHMTVAIYTNNGIERQNETLKYKHLDGKKNCNLTEMVTRVVTSFLPETHRNMGIISVSREINCLLSIITSKLVYPSSLFFRYIELNVRFSPGYSVYNRNLPAFLKNRPRDMVQHILSRYGEAQSIDTNSIVDKGEGHFTVKSSSRQNTHHTTSFGINNSIPSCTCKDWQRFKLPCKHFCAVFHHVPGWGWHSLSPMYRDNPIFSLDERYLGHTPNTIDDGCDEDDPGDAAMWTSTVSVDDVKPTQTCKLPAKGKKSKKWILKTQCGSVLREITQLAFLVHDEEYLQLLKNQLEDVLEDVRGHTPHDGPFPLNTSPTKTQGASFHANSIPSSTIHTKTEGASSNNITPLNPTPTKRTAAMAKLPAYRAPNKNRKNPYTNRVGQQAEMMRSNFRCNVMVQDDDTEESLQLTVVDLTEETGQTDLPSDDEKGQGDWSTINHTSLTAEDRKQLQVGEWLTDKHINCSQHLLKEEYYPIVDGFRDTVVLASSTRMESSTSQLAVPAMAECVQLHHLGNHWVVSSAKEGDSGGITVYDSLYTSLGIGLRRQLATIYQQYATADEGVIPVKVICAQRQIGSSDCGLFAIANAVALAEGRCPTDIEFHQMKMREHLDWCLTEKSLPMFPHSTRVAGHKNLQQSTYQMCIFCICLEYRQDAPMIQCDQCANWYHYHCVNMSPQDVAILVAEEKYICPTCR
ncbi:uncharacterized protein LOC118432224 [Branchiostoma floridae]|uniref:Uncharacterized protein LOC118432224 n=1 Tax=Branchiostoma floridae TaxID=7739 RepID=A0A9J7NDM8_BRAFL|nr:uncharacterized protein LOC118432224 [Branchiostoma floridae]